jgi:hypothetical protein
VHANPEQKIPKKIAFFPNSVKFLKIQSQHPDTVESEGRQIKAVE